MATIRLERKSEYINRAREYTIILDGNTVGTISNGETKDFTITKGTHTIRAKIDWCSSPDFNLEIEENETCNLRVGGFKNRNEFMLTGLGIMALHFILSKFANFEYTIYLAIPVALILIYYLTFGRKKYLTIEYLD